MKKEIERDLTKILLNDDSFSFNFYVNNNGEFDSIGGKKQFLYHSLLTGSSINCGNLLLNKMEKDELIEVLNHIKQTGSSIMISSIHKDVALNIAEKISSDVELFNFFVMRLNNHIRAIVALEYNESFLLNDIIIWAIAGDSYSVSRLLHYYLLNLSPDSQAIFSKRDYWRQSVLADAVFCSDVIGKYLRKYRSGGFYKE